MSKIIIFGTGDIAQIANYYFNIDTPHKVIAFTVNKKYITTDRFEDLPVYAFEDIEKAFPPSEYKMFIALSYSNMNRIREEKYFEAKAKGYELISYISSKCSNMTQYEIGDNCFIFVYLNITFFKNNCATLYL